MLEHKSRIQKSFYSTLWAKGQLKGICFLQCTLDSCLYCHVLVTACFWCGFVSFQIPAWPPKALDSVIRFYLILLLQNVWILVNGFAKSKKNNSNHMSLNRGHFLEIRTTCISKKVGGGCFWLAVQTSPSSLLASPSAVILLKSSVQGSKHMSPYMKPQTLTQAIFTVC